MSMSAASRRPVGQQYKPHCSFSRYEWGWSSGERFMELDSRHSTLVLPVCERLLLSYKLSHKTEQISSHPHIQSSPWFLAIRQISTWRGIRPPPENKHLSLATPLLSFPRFEEVFPFTRSLLHFHTHCPTFQRTSIYYLQLSTLLSENSVSLSLSCLRHFSLIRGIAPTASDPPSRSIFPSFFTLFSLWNAWFSFCAIRGPGPGLMDWGRHETFSFWAE